MKPLRIYSILVLLLCLLLAGGAALSNFLQSPAAVSWLFKNVSRYSSLTIAARSIQGGLGSPLQLEGFSLSWPQGMLTADKLQLRYQPLLLPFGALAVKELAIKNLTLHDNSPPTGKDPQLVWPVVSGLPTMCDAWIDRFSITGFSYKKQGQQVFGLPDLSAAVFWRNARLSFSDISLDTGQGKLSGMITAGLNIPALFSTLTLVMKEPAGDLRRIELRTSMEKGQVTEQLTGKVTVTATSDSTRKYSLSGEAGLGRTTLSLRDVAIVEQGRSGELLASGTLGLNGKSELLLRANNLDISAEAGSRLALNGTIDLKGEIDKYNGQFQLATTGADWRSSRISGELSGTLDAVTISGLKALLLGGEVNGRLRLDWQNDLTVTTTLHGSDLNPAMVEPTWNGVVNFDMDSAAVWRKGRLRQAKGNGRLRESSLHGRTLSGEIVASVENYNLSINRLHLNGKGFDISAAGSVKERLNLYATISDLSALIPQAEGSLTFKGRGRYTEGFVSGDISGQGEKLVFSGMEIKSTRLHAAFTDDPTQGISIEAALIGLSYHGVQVENADLEIKGSQDNHQGTVSLRSKDAAITASISGGYARSRWQGELSRLFGHDRTGSWQLTAPARITISSKEIYLTRLALSGRPAEHAELQGAFSFQPLRLSADASWRGINLARADQWLTDGNLTGASSGQLHAQITDNKRLILQGNAAANGTVTIGKRSLKLQKAELLVDAGAAGSTANFEFTAAKGSVVSARFISAEPATMKLPSQGHLQAAWDGIDAALVNQWLPDGMDLNGHLSGRAEGKMFPQQRFELQGMVQLADGTVDWLANDHHLHADVTAAKLDWQWHGDYLSGDLSLGLEKAGAARATFRLPLAAKLTTALDRHAPLKGTFSGKFEDNGRLAALFPEHIRNSKGILEVDLQTSGTLQSPCLDAQINLSKVDAFLPDMGVRLTDVELIAKLNGEVSPADQPDSSAHRPRLKLQLQAEASGNAARGENRAFIHTALLNLKSGTAGTDADLQLKIGDDFFTSAGFRSPQQLTMAIPESGDLTASWGGLNTSLARQWLPPEFDLHGQLSGKLAGKLLPKKHFDLHGDVSLTGARGLWRDEHQELTATLRTSKFTWNWRNETLQGEFELSLVNLGEAKGDFQLPFPARFDTAARPDGPVKGSLSGRFHEKGIITSFFPGLLQETKGLLELDLIAAGSWQSPTLKGSAGLSRATAYLPRAGIRLEDIRIASHLDGNELFIDSFSANSGKGNIMGSATLIFKDRNLTGYHGIMKGKEFQTVHLPELQLALDPDITFDGTPKKFSARGDIRVAEMKVNSLKSSTVIKPSGDVVMFGTDSAPARDSGPQMDLKIHLLLGDKTFVKAGGLDARLEGALDLKMTGTEDIKGRGEINVAKGSYRFHNSKLDIKRGKAIYSDAPIESPSLDILALREIDNIKAGVTVTGTPDFPLVKLYSEPAMTDTEIIAYLLLGQKRGTTGEQSGLLMQAASLVTFSNDSMSFEDQLKQLVSLDTITLAPDQDRSYGYRPIESSFNSTTQKNSDPNNVSNTMLQLGKYLTPQLYISYGRSLFDASQQVRARYTLGRQLEIESKVSTTATGGDLYYLIELE